MNENEDNQKSNLTLKQQLFVEAYLGKANGNATEAARIAGYKQPQMHGSRLMKNDEIASRVRKRVEQAAMSANEVLQELSQIGRADWQHYLEIIRNKNGETVDAKIVLKDKVRALELLGQYHSLFATKIKVDLDVTKLSDEELAAAKAAIAADITRA